MKTTRGPQHFDTSLILSRSVKRFAFFLLTASLAFSACTTVNTELLARQNTNLVRLGEIRATLVHYQELRALPASQLAPTDVSERDSISSLAANLEREMDVIASELRNTTPDRSGRTAAILIAVPAAIWAAFIAVFAASGGIY